MDGEVVTIGSEAKAPNHQANVVAIVEVVKVQMVTKSRYQARIKADRRYTSRSETTKRIEV